MPMTPEQLTEYTSRPLLAVLTTINPSGSPQATPIWYYYDGQHFISTAFTNRVKIRNMQRDPRVTLVVTDTTREDAVLIVQGTAELVLDGAREATERLAMRYLGEEEGKRRAAQLHNIGERVLIRVTPRKIIS